MSEKEPRTKRQIDYFYLASGAIGIGMVAFLTVWTIQATGTH